ncbi:unnamed protein product [Durusdinium trenchii]
MVPAVLFINGGIAISAACDKGAIDLPKEIEPGRRLMNPLDLPVKRQWDIAQCTVDAIDATRSVAAIGLSMDAVARNCPVNYATPFTEELSRTACTVDVSVLLTSFTRLVFYLALAVNHCSPEPERDAICLVGVAAIAAGGTTTSAGAAGTHATCNLGRKRQFIQRLEEMQANETLPEEDAAAAAAADAAVNNAPFNIIRRLVKRRRLRSLNRSREMERIDEIWLKLGYNLSDANASWLKEDSNPEILEIQAEAEDFRRNVASSLTASQPEWAPGMPLKESNSSGEVLCTTDSASLGWRNEVLGEPMTLEEDALACQARCSGIRSCGSFSYWTPGGHCHILGHLLMPKGVHQTTPGWVSGPPVCHPQQLLPAARKLAEQHRECYHSHALYQPLLSDVEPQVLQDALDCQSWCEQEPRCAFFSYFALSGLCHLAPANATKLQPVLNFVGGPKVCEYEFKTQDGEFTQDGGDTQWPMLGQCTLVGFLAVLIISAVICQPHKEIFGFNFHRIGRMASPYAAAPIVPAVEEDA